MTRNLARSLRAAVGLGAAALALLAGQGSALAAGDPCTNRSHGATTNGGPVLFDSQGYYYDTDGSTSPFTRDSPYATLHDSGSNGPTDTPPGPNLNSDSYDKWGALFVGGDADSNMYWDGNETGCTRELGGQQIAFAQTTINGLLVQRRLFVGSSGLPGARLVEYVTNPGPTPVNTSVQVGDTKSTNDNGDLGSDNTTGDRADSAGAGVVGPQDFWAVTTDAPSGALSDNALAHVFDGLGGAQRIDFATLTGTDGTAPNDNLAYRWDNVGIAPGQTAAFMSFEVQQVNSSRDAATSIGLARDQALAHEAAPFEQLYAGMSDAQIAAVRNWAKPMPTAKIGVSPSAIGADNVPLTFNDNGSFASASPGICQGRSTAWNFGDGTSAPGDTASHKFAAGQHDVTLTITNSCGQVATATQHVVIADKTAPTAKLSLTKKTTFANLAKNKVKETVSSTENGSVQVVATLPSAIAKNASAAKISKTVIKVHATLVAGKGKKVTLKLSKKSAKRLKAFARSHKGKTFKLIVKTIVKDSAGNAKAVTKTIKVRF